MDISPLDFQALVEEVARLKHRIKELENKPATSMREIVGGGTGVSREVADATYVNVSGDTMTGNLNMAANIVPTTAAARDVGADTYPFQNVYSQNVFLKVPTPAALVYLYARTNAGVTRNLIAFNQTTGLITFGHAGILAGAFTGTTFTMSGSVAVHLKAPLVDMFSDAVADRYFRFGQTTASAQITANAANLGKVIFIDDGETSGTPSQILICYRDAADAYHWRDIISGADV